MQIDQRPIGPRTLRERLSDLYRNGIVIGPKTMTAVFIVVTGLGLYLGEVTVQERDYKRNLISQLRPHIEKLDKRPGLSLEDLEKAGLPTYYYTEGVEIDLSRLPTSSLEKSLEEYQSNKLSNP